MSWIAVGVGGAAVVGGAMQYIGGKKSAKAAQKSARAQAAEAYRQRTETMAYAKENQANTLSAMNSIEELNAFGQSLGYAQKQADQDQRLIDSIDPALMDASKQVLGLLKGDTSGVGNIVNNQRAMQRQKLLSSLREQLGPGAETSTAGIQALTRFDSESASLSASTQGQSLASLMGLINGRPTNAGAGNIAQIGQLYGNRANRMGNATMQTGQSTLNAMMGTNAQVLQTTGHQYLGDQLSGRAMQQFGGQIVQGAATMAGGMYGGGGGGAAGKVKPTT